MMDILLKINYFFWNVFLWTGFMYVFLMEIYRVIFNHKKNKLKVVNGEKK